MQRTVILIALFAACDSKATASDPQGGARAEQKSREYESCGASLHCQDNLRCFEGTCRRVARSAVGDYYAAVGAATRNKGELEASIAAYAQALGQYDAEKVPLPPEIDCAYGVTLAAAKGKKENAELAARVLHRCVLAVPVGSRLREQAFVHLATLDDTGLDPLLLGASKLADVYLTKAPAGPKTDKLVVTVTANPQPAKSFQPISDRLASADLRPGMIACWEAYHNATKKDALAVTVPVKSGFVPGEYDDDPGTYVQKFEAVAAGADASETCIRNVVEPAIKALKLSEGFNTKLTITIK
jgi:hypothetical protein